MSLKLYSEISNLICINIKNRSSYQEFLKLIILSYEYVCKNPTENSVLLHNKYIQIGKLKYGEDKIIDYTYSPTLNKLKNEFEKDPSDMRLVTRLAIEYAEIGQKKRALQLLERVESSGYPERDTAAKLVKQLHNGERLK